MSSMTSIFFARSFWPPRLRAALKAAAVTALALLLSAEALTADRLGSYPIDPAQVSVAGISSGAFMANQLHVAHSAGVMGAAMIAGGLYGCAVLAVEENGVRALASQAVYDCMRLPDNLKEASDYADQAKQFEAKGWIDPISNLGRSKVYFFAGGSDAVVDSQTVETGKAVYEALGAHNIVFEDRSGPAANAGHSWVTKDFGGACNANAPPFIDNCGYDQAGAELKAIYGSDLKPPRKASPKRIVAFDQQEFVPDGATAAHGLSDTGYVYVPKACKPNAATACKLQVVLHGCQQSTEKLGDVFYTNIGVNEWAEANRIVVLYPQAHATSVTELPDEPWIMALLNSNLAGCWNWWGYADDRQYLTKKGVQVDAIWKMIERMEGK